MKWEAYRKNCVDHGGGAGHCAERSACVGALRGRVDWHGRERGGFGRTGSTWVANDSAGFTRPGLNRGGGSGGRAGECAVQLHGICGVWRHFGLCRCKRLHCGVAVQVSIGSSVYSCFNRSHLTRCVRVAKLGFGGHPVVALMSANKLETTVKGDPATNWLGQV